MISSILFFIQLVKPFFQYHFGKEEIMFDTFTILFDTLRSLLTSNEPIDTEKIQTITSNKSNLLNITTNSVRSIGLFPMKIHFFSLAT